MHIPDPPRLGTYGDRSFHRRALIHDYYAPFIYHIILKKAPECDSFGDVEGDARIVPGAPGSAAIKESPIGKLIAKGIIHLQYDYPIVKVFQYCVMPDHVHILLQVLFRSELHLDFFMESLKAIIARRVSVLLCRETAPDDIFQPGYCDKPLYDDRSLDELYRYIRENPHRLAMRMQFPQFFRRARKLHIQGREYEAYGNLFLLRNPDKIAIKISRSFSAEEHTQKETEWLAAAAQGAVLVSPFISAAERALRSRAEAIGAKIILITHEDFPERYKPHAHDFDLCAQGNLLIISLGLPAKTALTRDLCLRMNDLAAALTTDRKE
ncbi:MAG: transposase [Muribaculaceae bacterium]|nr:transposase [Muribaculaceae bacterium]